MSDFHEGDLVYVSAVGSVSQIHRIVTARSHDGRVTVIGYDTDFGTLPSDQMQLVCGGESRTIVEEYLQPKPGKKRFKL